jgi:hypothetical protein
MFDNPSCNHAIEGAVLGAGNGYSILAKFKEILAKEH